MKLTAAQIADYDRNGFLTLPDMFSDPELDALRSKLKRVSASDAPAVEPGRHWRNQKHLSPSHRLTL